MKPIVLSIIITLLLCSIQLDAQSSKRPNSWEAKVLFLDHYTPAGASDGGIGVGLEAGYHRHISNLLTIGVPFKVAVADIPNATDFDNRVRIVSLDAVARFRKFTEESKFVPYGFAGVGAVFESINGETNDNFYPQIPIGAGLNYRLGPWGYATAQAEYRLTMGDEFERDNLQLGLGLMWMIGKPEPKAKQPKILDVIADADEDGILDKDDDCPDVAGLAAFKGCPDTDGDGIADSTDRCPEEFGTLALMGCPDSDGDGVSDADDDCPDVRGALMGCPDIDGDGIADKDDACPDIAGSLMGCPDKDADGIADKDDQCPNLAGVASKNGCPQISDRDGDGVADNVDACPSQAGLASNSGCPAMRQEVKEVLDFAMRAVRFETGSAKLKTESYDVLDQIAGIMREYSYNNLRINGHTDNVGDAGNNLRLSEQRAKTCMEYLINKGISPVKMTYVGYGEGRPIADNDTTDGRYLNRRVEFEIFVP